jgi:multidrug efflux pump subunit AcrB
VDAKFSSLPSSVSHFNGQPAEKISIGMNSAPSKVIASMENVVKECLPLDMSFAWSGSAYLSKSTHGAIIFALLGGLLMLFLTLAALYGRWILPLIVLLVIPFGILGALLAILMRGIDMDLYFQVGLIASIGICAKNSILIIEFARLKTEEGMDVVEAAKEACRQRFRPIVLTSLSMILAVFPLTLSTGAGAASKHSVGTGILGGMLLATLLGIFFVPFFFRLIERNKKEES